MDIIWAPWREKYVEHYNELKKGGCVFCRILKEKKDKQNYIFLRSKYSFAVLNIYPFNGGHSLVLPTRHVADLADLPKAELGDLMDTLLKAKTIMHKALKPHALNIGLNLGHIAGAGIPEHLHFHIVPRWSGDVNFMPAVFGTKIIPVSLETVYKRFRHANKARSRKA